MNKIAAFIEFDNLITKKILSQKKNVKKKFGDQTYLDHPVHLTLFTLKIQKVSDLKMIYLKEKKKTNKPFLIEIKSPDIFIDDPLTKGHTIYYRIKKSKTIKEIQLTHLKKINKKIKVFKNDINFFNNPILDRNYKKYGFPFVGDVWIPHITIASLKNIKPNNKFVSRFLKSKINAKCSISEIKFYKIIKDNHKYLFSVKNI
jgi:2'-5' RNA ligase